MSKRISWIIAEETISVNWDGNTHIVKRSDALAGKIIKALKEGREQDIPALVDSAKRIETFSKGNFTVKDSEVYVNGVRAPRVLGDRIAKYSKEDLPFQPLIKFTENLQKNPSFRAVNELYGFLEKNEHPITQDGNFIAYKRVTKDFKDIYTGTFDNSVGNTVEMPRNQVNEDANQTCSDGLHVANWHYAHTQFGSNNRDTDIMLEVEINPADVVAIPTDYNNSKMRVCKYKVLGVVTTPYEGPSLRVTDPSYDPTRVTDSFSSAANDEEEAKGEACIECGAYAVVDGVCDMCEADQDEEEKCESCDEVGCDGDCCCSACGESDCYGECEDEEDEEDDRYPFEDEIEDE